MKARLRQKKKEEGAEIAGERVSILFKQAEERALNGELELADSMVGVACGVAMKFNLRIPKAYKHLYCRKCHSFLLPAKTSRTRINSGRKRVEVECLKCGYKDHQPYAEEIKEKRRGKSESKKEVK